MRRWRELRLIVLPASVVIVRKVVVMLSSRWSQPRKGVEMTSPWELTDLRWSPGFRSRTKICALLERVTRDEEEKHVG